VGYDDMPSYDAMDGNYRRSTRTDGLYLPFGTSLQHGIPRPACRRFRRVRSKTAMPRSMRSAFAQRRRDVDPSTGKYVHRNAETG